MRERAVLFGSHGGVVGVVTEPEQTTGPRRAVLLSNVGTNHHAGPFRLWVSLARTLARDGWHVLRFDQSGLGDSAPREGFADDDGRRDLAEAVQWMAESFGIEAFVLAGLCSGVDAAHAVAVADARVIGAVFIDGYTYRTAGWRLRRHTLRYLQQGRWSNFVRRRVQRIMTGERSRAEVAASASQVFDREYPPIARFRDDVRQIVTRGAQLLFVFTGTVDKHYNGREQVYETLGASVPRASIDVQMHSEADHVFSSVRSRETLIASIRTWIARFDG